VLLARGRGDRVAPVRCCPRSVRWQRLLLSAGVVFDVHCRLLVLRYSLMGALMAPPAAGLVFVWLRRVPTRWLLRGTCLHRAALVSSSTQFDGGFNGAPGRIILVSLLQGTALLIRRHRRFPSPPLEVLLTPLALFCFFLEWW